MSMSDPIANMLTCIRNAQAVGKSEVHLQNSKIKQAIAQVLLEEGYIDDFSVSQITGKLTIQLKYYQNRPVIESIQRVSKPGLRIYRGKEDMPKVIGNMGIVIVSTPKGVMTGQNAYQNQVGGEVLCSVY